MEFRFCDETAFGFSWIADEPKTRTSHALVHEGLFWLIDPVNWPEAVDRALALGRPAGVIQLLDRHNRDCASLAVQLETSHHVVPRALGRSPFDVVEIRRGRLWQETALWWPEQRTLAVAEAIGTNPFFAPPGHVAGVHLLMRPTPPRRLAGFEPAHLLVGHGEGVHDGTAASALRDALDRSRRDLPRMLARLPGLARSSRRRAG